MKVIQRLPRTLVRAASVGAVMIAATLPLAVASGAGAAGTPATLIATALSPESPTTTSATLTASFAQGAYFATSVTPSGTITTGYANPVTDATVGGRLASGTTITKNVLNGASTSFAADNLAAQSNTAGTTYEVQLAAAQILYPGESLTVTPYTTGTAGATFVATVLTGTDSSYAAVAAGTSTAYALVSSGTTLVTASGSGSTLAGDVFSVNTNTAAS